MTDFDYEVKERKSLVPSAMKRKNGSKSKKCTLPSDYLTKKERENMNGDIINCQFNKPIPYSKFKLLSKQTREEYLNHLQTEYNASISDMAKAVGVAYNTLYSHIVNHKLNVTRLLRSKTRKNLEERTKWLTFLGVWKAPQNNNNNSQLVNNDQCTTENSSELDIHDHDESDPADNSDNHTVNIPVKDDVFTITITGALKLGETVTIKVTRD